MNVYLIESTSRTLLEEEIDKIVASSKNKIIYDAQSCLLEEILNEASYVSMFEEMKYLIIKNTDFFGAQKLNEKDEGMFLKYLEHPYPLCTVIFTTYEPVDFRKKISKTIKENYHYIKKITPKGLELYNKVANLLAEKKYLAEKDSINYIINACLGNYDLICNEIDKIDLYYEKPTKIKLETIKHLVSRTMVDNNFKFIDAIMEKDLKKANNLIDDFITLKVEPLVLINLLAREYRNMYSIKKMLKQNTSSSKIKEYLHLQDWQLEKTKKNALNYHEDDIKDQLIRLEKLDFQIKSGTIDKWVGIKLFLIDLFEY